MTEIKVNTEGIADTVERLRSADSNINDAVERLSRSGKRLEFHWESGAGAQAMTKMYELFALNEQRAAVMQNYIRFLQQQVEPNYTSAETGNTQLADQFR